MPQERVSRRSGHEAARSPSPQRRLPHQGSSAPNQQRRARSPSPIGRRARSPSPDRKAKSQQQQQQHRNGRHLSSPVSHDSRVQSPSRVRKANRPKSPTRNGYPASSTTTAGTTSSQEQGSHTLERFALENFSMKSAKWPSSAVTKSGPSGGMIWQHTMEPIQKPLLRHLVKNQQLSSLACAAFKAIMKYMGDFPTKKSNLQGTYMTDKIFQDALRHEELQDEIYCQIMKQLTDNKLDISEEGGWELMWLATGLFACSPILRPELAKFLRLTRHKLAEDCRRRLQVTIAMASHQGETRQRKYPPHWVEVETIQHHYTQIFHFIFFPDDKSNASFQVTSSMTVGDLCKSITHRLGLLSSKGFGLFLIMSERIIALHDMSDFFFDALQRQIDWEQEGIKSSKSEESDMPVLAYQMFFLRKVWTDVVPGEDPQADTIFHYHQELPKFLHGYYRCRREEAVKLAALRFRARYGNDKTELQNIAQRLAEFLPADLLRTGSMPDWKRAIISQYNQSWMTSMTKDAAKVAFLKIMYRWPTFGSSFFEVIKVTRSNTTENVLLAINKQGVLIIDPQTKDIMKTFPYSEIQGWAGSGQNDFVLTVGNEETGAMKLHFKTKMGYKMDDLLTSYVRYIRGKSSSSQRSAKGKPQQQKSL